VTVGELFPFSAIARTQTPLISFTVLFIFSPIKRETGARGIGQASSIELYFREQHFFNTRKYNFSPQLKIHSPWLSPVHMFSGKGGDTNIILVSPKLKNSMIEALNIVGC